MANSDKNIRITANRDTTALPKIIFTGQSNNPIALNVLDDNTISFEGSAGQLFSINNNLSSGYIFSINDISGIPSFRVNADGTVGIAEFLGNVGIGLTNPAYKLQISGSAGISGTANISGVLTLSSTTGSGSTSTGALVVSGGVGIGGSIFSSSAYASSLSGVVFNNGAITNTGTITSTGVMSISNSSTTAFQVRDGSNNPAFVIDTIGDIISLPVAIASTTTGTGSLVVAGGVGIGGSVNVGGRVGIGTNLLTGQINIRTSSASTPAIVVQGSASQTADYAQFFTSTGSTSLSITKDAEIKFPLAQDIKLYATAYGSVGAIKTTGNFFAYGGLIFAYGVSDELSSVLSPTSLSVSGLNWSTYSSGSSIRWATNNPVRIQPTGTSVVPLHINLNNASWTSGNAFEIANNGDLRFSVDYTGSTRVLSTVGSASTTTGALVVYGGVGIGQTLFTSPSYASSVSGVILNNGTITGSLSGTATTANNVRIASAGNSNSSHLITFTPNSSSSGSAISSDSTFSFNPSTEILSVSGVAITSTAASTSTTTGALIVAGGVGIGGSVNIGRQLTVSGTTRLNSSVFNNPPTSSIGASLLQSGYIFGSYWTGFQVENGYLIYGRQVPGGFIIIEEPLTGAQVGGTGNVFAEALQHFKWGNDKYVVLASTGNSVLYSTSPVGAGNSWYYATLPTTASWQKLEYGNNRFIAIATGSTSAYSLDGINWTLSTLPGSYTWSDIKHGNGVFVAGAGSTVAYTYDGIEWTIASNNVSSTYITFGNGLFFANSTSNTASYSRDGINWTNTTLPSDTHRASAYGNGVFVNVGNSTTSYYSTDLITWISGPGGSDGTTPKFLYFNNLFYFKENGSGYGKVVTGPSGTLDFSPRFTGDINNVRIGAENPGAAEFTALSAVGPVRFVSNLQSTSTKNGALVVTGGVGIGQSLFTSSSYASSISGVTFNNGAITNTGTITSTGVMSISNSSTTAFAVRDGSNSSKFNVDTVGGIVSVLSSTASTSTSSGALVVSGGVGIGGSVIVGGRVGIGTVPNLSMLNIQTSSAGTTGLSIIASSSQSAPLLEWWSYGGIIGLNQSGRIKPTGELYLGNQTYTNLSSGTNPLFSLQGRGATEGMLIKGFNSGASEVIFEVQGNTAAQLFGIYGDGGVNAPRINVTNSTGSTNSSTGALIVTGGVGIGGTLNVNTANVVRDFNHTPNITTIGGASGWVASTASTFINPSSFRYLNNKYIGIGGTYIYYSDDMLNWSTVNVPNLDPTRSIADIIYGEGKYVFVQNYTANAGYSTNLTNWTNVAISYNNWFTLAYGNGTFVVTSGGSPYAVSSDGINWANTADATHGFNTDIKFINGYFYSSSSGSLERSTDGITWQTCNTPAVPYGLTYGNGLYVGGVYNSGTIVYSYDGLNFLSYTGSSLVHKRPYYFNGVYYITTQNNSVIRYSTDGFNWLNSTGFPGNVDNMVYAQGKLYVGSGATVWVTNATPGRFEVNPLRTGNLDDVEIGRYSPNSANFIDVSVNNNLNVSSRYSSISPLNGALTVAGGVGIGGSLYVASATAISGVTINAGVITGSLTGTATTSTYSHQSGYAITSGSSATATTATYSHQSGYATTSGLATTATYSHQSGYATTSGLATTATYSHQSGYATTSGLATTSTYSHQSGYATTSGLATTATYSYQSGYGITAGLATTATYAHQSGYAITSGTSGSATTANNINVANALTNSAHTLLFSPTATGSGVAVSSNTTLSYNPSSFVLSTSGLAITATTASSSTSNGALQVAGGVGISGRLSFNQAAFGTTGIATNPTMAMIGNTGDPIFLSILEDNTISFEGSQGQLFSITPNLSTGYIYSVNDITGIPLLRANANANVTANEYAGNFGIGLSNPGYKLHVLGSVGFTSTTASTSTTTGTLVVSGGVGIGGSLNVNSPSNISNVIINNGVITGNLTGTATTSGFATTASYSNQAGYAITAGSATTATYSHQAGYAITAGSATTAFTAVSTTSVSVASAGNSNLAHPILITNNPSSGSAVSSDSTFTFNPSTEILNVSGISITSSTGSSNTTTGALIVTGGVGIGGSLNVGNKTRFNDEVYINTISDYALVVGGSGSVSYRWNVGSTLTANRFNLGNDLSLSPVGGSQSVVQSFWGLQLTGNTFVTPSGFTPTSYGSAGAIGVLVPNQQASRVAFGIIAHASQTGDLQIWTSSTASTSSPYLAVKADGQIYSYANIPATSFSSGALVVSGGVGIGGSLFVNGDLTINGTTTTINSVTISVDDKNIELGSVSSPSDVTAEGGGITLKGATDKFINWYSGVGWSSSESWNLVSGNSYKINNASVLNATTLGTGVTNSSLTSLGTITTGVWAGTLITANYGGVGLTTPFTVGDILYANTSTTWGRLTAGTSGHLLSSTGTGSTPSYVNPNTLTVGSATTASNLRIAVASSNLSHPVLFTPGSSTSGSAVSSDSTFSFNSSTEILSVSGVAITSTTSSSGSTTGALIVSGGVGIGGTVNIAGDETVLGRLYYSQSTVGVAGTSTIPSISFIGQDNNPITLSVLTDNTLSFEGSSGQLFSINNNLSSGTIFSVNDISGIPIIRANANGTLSMGEFTGTVGVGLTNPSFKFHVSGSAGFSGTIYATGNVSLASNTASTSTTNGALVIAGGVGIGGSLYVASATAISGVTINAGVITGSLTGLATTATYSHQSGYAITSGFATTASYAYQSGYAITSGSSGSATTAFNINIVSATTNASHQVLFTPASGTASGAALSTESTFVYNPSTDILSVSGLAVTSGTASTSPTTGALVVTGGVGIGQTLFTSSSYASSISGVVFNNGAITNTGTITSTGVMSISNSSTTAFSVKDGSNDTKFNVNTIGGIVSVSSSTASTNTSTGAFTVSGGVGIGGTLNANSVVTYNRLQNQSFSGSAVGATDGRMGGYGAILGHDRITFGNGVFVTNSSWGAYNAAYSTDGLNWTASALPVNQGYPVTIYGNGYFVLAATGATNVLYSANGSSWSQVSIGNTESRTTGAYGNGKYVIVGGGTTYNYSSDLLIWSTGTLPLTGDWRIAYGNGVFVAIAYGTDRLIYSYDGINWNIGNTNSGNRNFQKITYTNGKFMVTAWSGGGTWYSYDGINWVLTSNSGGDVYNLSYGNGAYFTNDALKYTYSSDGFNWSSFVNFSAGYESFQSAYGLNKFITGGRVIDGPTNTVTIEPKFTGEINNVRIGAVTPASGDFTNLSSTGSANLVGTVNVNNLNILSKVNQTPVLGGFVGTTGWTSASLLSGAANYGLAFGNGLFVSIRKTTNSTSFSSDGKRWVASNMPFAGDWMSIAWGVDKFVAVASSGTTGAYSGNGISWTSMSMPATAQGWYAVTYGDDKFVAVGNTSTTAYSSDGITWTGSSIANTNWTGVAYGNGTFVAVSGFGLSGAYSYDGINWNLINLPTNGGTGIKFITYGNGYFIVANYVNNDINYSRDGINWSTTVRTSTYGIKTDIAYGNGIYSIFNYQEATYSYDGVNWLLGNTIAATDWQAVAYGNNRFVATSVNTGQVGSIDGPSNTLNLHPKFTGDIDNVRIGAKQPGAAEFTNLAAQQPVRFTANTASINTNTGALVVVGGVGIGGSLNVSSATAISGVTINAGVITGSLTGTASTATYSHQSGYAITSGSSGAATTATYAHQSGYATTSGFATTATYSYQSGYGLTSGLATTATYSHQSGYGITAGLATTATYAHQSGYATTSGLATTATYSYQSGYGITAGFATSATSASIANTSYSVNVTAASANASHFLIFSPTATGSGVALSSESALVYNPSTDILSVSGLAVTSGTASTSATTGALVVTGGVGIGLTLTVGLGISTPVISAPANLLLKPGVDSTTGIQFTRSSAALPVLTIDTLNSRVGIGLTNPEFDFEVNGSISATTKSFVIEHPTKQGMKLRYGSLEGPENGVYVRGELKDNNTIILPDYWSELVDESSITVHLTPIGNKFVYVKEIKKDSIIVGSMFFQKIHCYYSVWAERKDVPKLKVEF